MVVVSWLNASKRREGGGEVGKKKERSQQNKLIKDASNPETPGVTSLAGYSDSENNKHRDRARDERESRGYRGRRGVGERWRVGGSRGGGGVIRE